MDARTLQEVRDFAVSIARAAGELTLRYFSATTPFELKADNTPVTVADRGAEELLRREIERRYPTHGIVGEEYGEKLGHEPARWILDPIDGTMSFICGVPLYSVLVGFEWEGQMAAGVLHLPALGETLYAARGSGCWCNGRAARVSTVSDLAHARLSTTTLKLIYKHGRGAAYERLRDRCHIDRGWPDSYAYALLATGRVDVVLDPLMALWDSAALVPVVTEAGGTFTDWGGRPTHTAPEALATNGRLFDPVMAVLGGRAPECHCS